MDFHRQEVGTQAFYIAHFNCDLDITKVFVDQTTFAVDNETILAIAGGYPPFYRQTIKVPSGAIGVSYPVTKKQEIIHCDDNKRGGWVVAAGLSIDEPIKVYKELSTTKFEEACKRVGRTISVVIKPAFGPQTKQAKMCDTAIIAIARMNEHTTDSGIPTFLDGTDLEGCTDNIESYTGELNNTQCRAILNLFNDLRYSRLKDSEPRYFEPILRATLAAAVRGVYRWWYYKNNIGQPLHPFLTDTLTGYPIWIRDCMEEEKKKDA